MNRSEFQQALLRVMKRKAHWAWPAFTGGLVAKDLLYIHFEQEYATYVRDFPIMIGRAYVQCPVAKVRRELAGYLYEEETGGLSEGWPHQELFLEYPRGLGMNLDRFKRVELLPRAVDFRVLLDEATRGQGWEVAAAVTALFLAGTEYELGELEPGASLRPQFAPSEHPLVKYYDLPIASLALSRAHHRVVSRYRKAAWHIMLDFVDENTRPQVLQWLGLVRHGWMEYRDDVARACGLIPNSRVSTKYS